MKELVNVKNLIIVAIAVVIAVLGMSTKTTTWHYFQGEDVEVNYDGTRYINPILRNGFYIETERETKEISELEIILFGNEISLVDIIRNFNWTAYIIIASSITIWAMCLCGVIIIEKQERRRRC